MANTYSALKRVRQTERRTEINKKSKTRLRHQIRAMRRALLGKDAKAAAELLPKTFSIIDRSAKSGIIKMNTAARYKSKLHQRVKALRRKTAGYEVRVTLVGGSRTVDRHGAAHLRRSALPHPAQCRSIRDSTPRFRLRREDQLANGSRKGR